MSNVKISALPTASTPLTGAELVPIVQSGITSQTTVDALLAEQAGSSFVGYLPSSGTATTVQAKLRETVSVKDFGAVGNGIADDTQAIKDAIAAAYKFSTSLPGLQKGAVYFPEGQYKITSAIDATSIGALYGESRHSTAIIYSGASATFTCYSSMQINDLSFIGTGTQTAISFPVSSYLSQVIGNSFYNFATAISYGNSSNTSSIMHIQLNTFQSCTTSLAFSGTLTTIYIVGNQFNTGTTAISCGGNFCTQITNNIFEDVTTAILVPLNQVCSYGVISGNWFERTNPYVDNSAGTGYFQYNTFCGNRYNAATVNTYGTNSVVMENGTIRLTYKNKLAAETGRIYDNYECNPVATTASAYTAPYDYTFRTQDAASTQAANGGDFIFRLGAPYGSTYRHGAVRPYTDNLSNLGDSSYRWSTAYISVVKQTVYTVATLPSASTSGAGAKAFVSDATATTFASNVVGGGANNVPVYSDGTNWKIG